MENINYFNELGRCIPACGDRVFSRTDKTYYKIESQAINYSKALQNLKLYGGVSTDISENEFENACNSLIVLLQNNINFKNLLKGIHVPFITRKIKKNLDLGDDLVNSELASFRAAFNSEFPDSHFKAILQGNSRLQANIKIDERSRHRDFLECCQSGPVVGWYFPQAFQGFDIESQRNKLLHFPEDINLCLSGGIDIFAALTGTPGLLINENFYAPILCLSAYIHTDPRLVLLIKAYGPHMEFWCMSQMLTKTITQVSEQWTGGITIYTPL